MIIVQEQGVSKKNIVNDPRFDTIIVFIIYLMVPSIFLYISGWYILASANDNIYYKGRLSATLAELNIM